MDIEEHAEYNL